VSIKVDVATTIARSPDDVFAVLTDVAHHTDWAKGPETIKDISDSPVKLGTTWTQVSRLVGKKVEIHANVDRYEANRSFGYVVDKPISFHMLWQLEPAGPATKITVHVEGEPGGFFGVAAPLLKKALAGTVTSDLATLKAQLEAKK
jgi:uncharacterized protein YndB with AHSA1/START domain